MKFDQFQCIDLLIAAQKYLGNLVQSVLKKLQQVNLKRFKNISLFHNCEKSGSSWKQIAFSRISDIALESVMFSEAVIPEVK